MDNVDFNFQGRLGCEVLLLLTFLPLKAPLAVKSFSSTVTTIKYAEFKIAEQVF